MFLVYEEKFCEIIEIDAHYKHCMPIFDFFSIDLRVREMIVD